MDVIERDQVEAEIQEALHYDYVIAHIYSGLSNISDPKWWISKFSVAGFRCLSFVLDIGLEAGKNRCLARDSYRTKEQYVHLWTRFRSPPFSEFATRAGVQEITIDAEQTTDAICRDILAEVRLHQSNKM